MPNQAVEPPKMGNRVSALLKRPDVGGGGVGKGWEDKRQGGATNSITCIHMIVLYILDSNHVGLVRDKGKAGLILEIHIPYSFVGWPGSNSLDGVKKPT